MAATVARVEAERDKYLLAFSEQFDQREEYVTECKRLWRLEERVEALRDRWVALGCPEGAVLGYALDGDAGGDVA